MIKQTLSEIKSELKPAKLISLAVVIIVLGFILSWLSKRNAAIAKLNPLVVK